MLFAPRREEHSRKPDGLHALLEAVTDGPGLELFGRETRPGWVGWGDQTGLFDDRHKARRDGNGSAAGRSPANGVRR